jgi:hypothetical protein
VSISELRNDFDSWLAAEFAQRGAFTALAILVGIGERKVTPLCSTYFSVIGDDIEWGELTILFRGSGVDWDGVTFFPVESEDGKPADNPTARSLLRALEARVDEDRLVLNEGHLFDKWGRRMMVEEIFAQ